MILYSELFVVSELFEGEEYGIPLSIFTSYEMALEWSLKEYNFRYTNPEGPLCDEKYPHMTKEKLVIEKRNTGDNDVWLLKMYDLGEGDTEHLYYEISKLPLNTDKITET
jgi:hypothetical protein